MPVIKYKTILKSIFKKPVFTPTDLHNEGVRWNYAKKLLHLLAKNGEIKQIERGKYTRLDDPVAVAPHITSPSYISLWTALSIHKLTTQVPFSVEVITSRRRFKNKIEFLNTPIIFHKVDPKMMFGYEHIIWKENARIPVARPEKAVIDALFTGMIPKEDLAEIIKDLDKPLLKKYSRLTGNKKIKEGVEKLCSLRKK